MGQTEPADAVAALTGVATPTPPLPPNLSAAARMLLRGYAAGIFPMADSRDDPALYWVEPKRRAVLPPDGLHISRRLRRTIRTWPGRVTFNRAFNAVVAECARPAPDRQESWINEPLKLFYAELRAHGHAHSVEVWDAQNMLVGGLYGVTLGAAFFGESMFSRKRDGSKIALAHLVTRLRRAGFMLLDCQFITDHLRSLGAVEISRAQYLAALARALRLSPGLMDGYRPDEMPQQAL